MIPWHQLYLTGAVLLSPATVALGSRLQHRGSRPSLRVRLSLIIAAAAAWPILLLGTVEMILVIAVGAARRRAAAPAHIPPHNFDHTRGHTRGSDGQHRPRRAAAGTRNAPQTAGLVTRHLFRGADRPAPHPPAPPPRRVCRARTSATTPGMGFLDDAKDYASKHTDQVSQAIDKAGDLADQKTDGKYQDTVDKVQDAAKKAASGDQPEQGQQPAPPPPPA